MSDTTIPNEKIEVNRHFKGIWIPREIWLADGLSAFEKVLWAEIHSLYDTEKLGCYASNEYLAKFIGLKERTIRDALCKFRQLKLIEDVSFNGRERVIKALEPDGEFSRRLAEWRLAAMQTGGLPPCRLADSRHPVIYRDTSIGTSLDTPPIPPQNSAEPKQAEACDVDSLSFPKKEKIKPPKEFSVQVQEFTQQMLDSLKRTKPDCRIPNNLVPMMTAVDFMLRLDKRDPIKLMDVFNWALADWFWNPKMFKPNPAEYLRKQFDQLDQAMNAPPPPKERKFAPSSDDARAFEIMRKCSEDAL